MKTDEAGRLAALLLLAAMAPPALAGRAPLQDPEAPPQEEEVQEIKRLKAWPAIPGKMRAQVKTDISRLRKARTKAMGEQAVEALIEAGPAAVPELLPVVAREKDQDALKRVNRVLIALTGPEHTRLLAAEFASKQGALRCWCLRRCAAFPDPGVEPQALEALARVRKKGDKADAEELYCASLCACSAGSVEGLAALLKAAQKHWGKRGAELRAALEGCRGPEATGFVVERIQAGERVLKVAGLRLLAGCGDESARAICGEHLSDTDNSIRVAAINALRGIVDREPPVDKLPVFEAIELADEWKKRLGLSTRGGRLE